MQIKNLFNVVNNVTVFIDFTKILKCHIIIESPL